MFEEDLRLREDASLHFLLEHYCASEDPDAWQDRVMRIEGVERSTLTALHGELIAYSWIEQNTGVLPRTEAGACPGSYRATPAGRKALTRHHRDDHDDVSAAA
jgi:hypothetical protein